MSIYSEQNTSGKWAKAAEMQSGIRCKIVSETNPQGSTFLNKDGSPKTQDVCKVHFEGGSEPLNVSLNRATINGLVRAFGQDSKLWMGQYLTVEVEKMRVAGKAVTAMYLIPEGFERVDDANGYAMIQKIGSQDHQNVPAEDIPTVELPF